jgi:hypothetical protein
MEAYREKIERKCVDCGRVNKLDMRDFYRWLRTNPGRDPMDYSCHNCSLRRRKKHGESRTRLFNRWKGLFARTKHAKNYVEKGIKVCPEWYDFKNFKRWAQKNGFKPELELDRIDNTGDYGPNNCRWISKAENVAKIWKDRDDATIKRYLAKGSFGEHQRDDENASPEASSSGGAIAS